MKSKISMKLKREDNGAPTLWGQVAEESNQLILDQSSLKSLHFPRKRVQKTNTSVLKVKAMTQGLVKLRNKAVAFFWEE